MGPPERDSPRLWRAFSLLPYSHSKNRPSSDPMKSKYPWLSLGLVTTISALSCWLFWRGFPQDAPVHRAESPAASTSVHARAVDRRPVDPELAALAAEENRDAAWEGRLRGTLRRALKNDPHGAAALMEAFEGKPSEVMAGLALAAAWAEIDPQSAYAWLRSLPPSGIRQSWYESAGTALGRIDPLAAVAQADQLAEGWDRREYLKAVVIGWQEKDFTAALTWADRLKPGPEREEVLIPLLSDWSQRQPVDAMNYVASSIPPGKFQEDAAFNVATNWLKTDPQAVAEWVGSSPAGELHDKLVLMIRDHQEHLAQAAEK